MSDATTQNETEAPEQIEETTSFDAGLPSAAAFADAETREILNLLGNSAEGGSCCGGGCCS